MNIGECSGSKSLAQLSCNDVRVKGSSHVLNLIVRTCCMILQAKQVTASLAVIEKADDEACQDASCRG